MKKVFLYLSLLATLAMPAKADFSDIGKDLPGLGRVSDSFSRELLPGSFWQVYKSSNVSGSQYSNVISFNVKSAGLEPVVDFGDYLWGGDRLSSLVSKYEDLGYEVVAAINGDSYLSNGVPKGMVIDQGILHRTGYYEDNSLGFTYDGDVVYGHPKYKLEAKIGSRSFLINEINKERLTIPTSVFLLTDSFGLYSNSINAGLEITIDMDGGFKGVQFGKSFSGKVSGVKTVGMNPAGNKNPIKKGQVIVAVPPLSPYYGALKGVKPGETFSISASFLNKAIDWNKVKTAIGVYLPLMESGNIINERYSDSSLAPRTSVGVTNGGSLILMENEGRQDFAKGLRFSQVVDFMKNKDTKHILGFDGGGSSTFMLNLPGFDRAKILNSPSDGKERANGNALLFLRKRQIGNLERLHIYPENANYRNFIQVHPGQAFNFFVTATDKAFNKADLDQGALDLSINDKGTFLGDRTVLAKNPGKGQVVAKHKNGASGSLDFDVKNDLKDIRSLPGAISIGRGEEISLKLLGYTGSSTYPIDSRAVEFELSDSNLGQIDSSGKFSAGLVAGKGKLKISLAGVTKEIDLVIGKENEVFQEFDQGFEEVAWTGRIYNENGARGGSCEFSIDKNPDFVKSGSGSLRIDYDFESKPLKGTVAIELGPKDGYGKLNLAPRGLGLWVYGDGSGQIIKAQMKPDVYFGEHKIDFTGWKYLYMPIPDGISYPYDLKWAIRLVADQNSPANKKKGSIYFDSLELVYGLEGALNKDISINRLAGANRFETSNVIAKSDLLKAKTGILVNSHNYPDALAISPFASELASPIFISASDKLEASTLKAMEEKGIKEIIIAGGTASVGSSVEKDLKDKGYKIERIAGASRYETALMIAKRLQAVKNFDRAYLTSGENYPDALSVTGLAYKEFGPILLSRKDSLDPAVKKFLQDSGIKSLVIAGGPNSISPGLGDELKAMGIKVERIAGANRYETSYLLANRTKKDADGYFISMGTGFIDALTAGPLAARSDRPLILLDPNATSGIDKLLNGKALEKQTIIGGRASIGWGLEKILINCLKK